MLATTISQNNSPSNLEFLTAIFKDDVPWCHVTGFSYPPDAMPQGEQLCAWMGDYFSRFNLQPHTNQYFTISCFYCDDQQKARRRKALFRHTNCIVLDDVREKLAIDEVAKLPSPSWVLETSEGSEQWGYILDTSCTNREQVENLLDGLVANGLAPAGKDPGMKGVTRYVRLPEGINNKTTKLVNYRPFKCRMLLWQPLITVTMEQLAAPFHVELDAPRRESRLDGAADVPDHPLVNLPDLIHIKEIRSNGRFDITCPWTYEHTGAVDDGSAVFTNSDNSIGFKCHHGACQERTGADLLDFIEEYHPEFRADLLNWQVMKSFDAGVQNNTKNIQPVTVNDSTKPVDFLGTGLQDSFMGGYLEVETKNVEESQPITIETLIDQLRSNHPGTAESRKLAESVLKLIDSLPQIEKQHYHDTVCDVMGWSATKFKPILKDLRERWYKSDTDDKGLFKDVVFIHDLNHFYHYGKRMFFTPEAFQNSFCHDDMDVRKNALQSVRKVDKIDYYPKAPRIFEEKGVIYCNTWSDASEEQGSSGDVSRWLDHFDVMGWGQHRDHILKFMAYTIQHPEVKINHMLLLAGREGCGKDFLLHPLITALGDNSVTVDGTSLARDFNSFMVNVKHIHFNEVQLSDRHDALTVGDKMKPIAAAPPRKLHINPKGKLEYWVRNILSGTMCSNGRVPLIIKDATRRLYAAWCDLSIKDAEGYLIPEWVNYWKHQWWWMEDNKGVDACIHYLRHEVDISDFNPKAPPPVTDFLMDIQDASKSPGQTTIEAFMSQRLGAFKFDLLTAEDMSKTLRLGELAGYGELMGWEGRKFSASAVGRVMASMITPTPLRGQKRTAERGLRSMRLWAIRDVERYSAMSQLELADCYIESIDQIDEEIKKLSLVGYFGE